MSIAKLLSLLAVLVFLGGIASGVEAGGVLIAENISLDKKVLFLNTRHTGRLFSVRWIDSLGRAREKSLISRSGWHAYETRGHPEWRKEASSVSVSGIEFDNGKVGVPSIRDEMDIFWSFEPWLRSTVNALWGHSLFGVSWQRILLVAGLAVAGLIFLVKKGEMPLSACLLCGLIFSMIFSETRSIWDHIQIAKRMSENESMTQTKGLAFFSRKLSERIGNKLWSQENLPVIAAINIAYGLSEKRYSPSFKNRRRYIISFQNGEIVLIPPKML